MDDRVIVVERVGDVELMEAFQYCSAAVWVARNEETGKVVDMKDASGLSAAMKRHSEDKKLRIGFCNAVVECFCRMFTFDTATDQYESL